MLQMNGLFLTPVLEALWIQLFLHYYAAFIHPSLHPSLHPSAQELLETSQDYAPLIHKTSVAPRACMFKWAGMEGPAPWGMDPPSTGLSTGE